MLWGRSGRGWRAAADAPPPDDDLEPPHEVILPELPSHTSTINSTTSTSLRLRSIPECHSRTHQIHFTSTCDLFSFTYQMLTVKIKVTMKKVGGL